MTDQPIEAPVEESKPKKAAKAKPTSATDKARAITLAKMAAKQK
jgi:hypothetical protein